MLQTLAVAALVAALFMIPIGLPGLWIMVGIVAVGAVYQAVGLVSLLLILGIAVVAEVLEFVFVKRYTTSYGGSRKAFWGAIAGGILGVVVGTPVPVIGSIVGAFVGTFLGAAMVTFAETRDTAAAGRVGWGVTLGRALAAAVKTFAGLAILILGAIALLA